MNIFKTLILILIIAFNFATENKFQFNESESRINFSLGDLQIKNEGTFSKINSEGFGSIALNGVPDLPMFSTMYQITPGKLIEVDFSITDSQIIDNIELQTFSLENKADAKIKYLSYLFLNFLYKSLIIFNLS